MGHLGETINHHLKKYRNQISKVIEKIENSLHVDDLSKGADEPKSAMNPTKQQKSIFAEANMSLRKWRSNNREVNEFIEGKHESTETLSDDTNHASLMLNPNEESENKILGKP